MLELAPELFLLQGFPRNAFNVYLMGGVLVDSGTRWAWRRIRRQLTGVPVTAHALTHGHPDHQGASRRVCRTFGTPLLCGAGDADSVESGDWLSLLSRNPLTVCGGRLWAGPACPVARRLGEGDEVGGFAVVETPGHSPGHVSFWRASDGVLVVGDVVNNLNFWKGGVVELRLPPRFFTPDPARNRTSARKLAALRPRLVCFGHGPPRPGEEFVRFVEGL